MDEKKEQYDNNEGRIRILVVDRHPIVRRQLTQLINHKSGFMVCGEAEDINQAIKVIEEKHVDLAVVDVSLQSTRAAALTEPIRLQHPALPVLSFCVDDEGPCAKSPFSAETERDVVNQRAAENIMAAIGYIQSLLKSQIFGFTVSVRV